MYNYDNWRNIAQINDGGNVTSYTYTGNNLLKTKTTPDNKTITYEYDARHNVSKVTDYSGTVTNYNYDEANRLIKVTGNGMTTNYEYANDQGLLSKVSYGSSGKYQTFEYNRQGEPTYIMRDSLPYNYTYDNNGNLLKESMGSVTVEQFSYDELNRLDEVVDSLGITTQYFYDGNNNIFSKEISHLSSATVNLSNAGTTLPFTNVTEHTEEMTYNAANQLVRREESITGTNGGTTKTETAVDTYTYTTNGSLCTEQETLGSAALSKTYTYNDRNQLIQYKEGSTVKGAYTYDPEGFRESKTADGVTTKFYWDRGYTINESDGTNFTARNTIGLGGIIARKTSAATTYLVKDIHGDTVFTLNENGSKNAEYDYFVYGEQWSHTGSQDNPYRYCGEYVDNETGFIYLRNRYYSPELGRFTSEDPAKDGDNWYVYCENNPVNFIDASGLGASPIELTKEYKMTSERIGAYWTGKVFEISEIAKKNAIKYADANGYYSIQSIYVGPGSNNIKQKKYDTWDNIVDAKRHMEWNSRMVREIGYGNAQIAGNNHELVSLREKGWVISEVGSLVKTYINQATLMDLRNNAIGRNLAVNPSVANYNYDQIFNYGLNKGVLITDATKAYEYFGINQFADDQNRLLVNWHVGEDLLYVYNPDGILMTSIYLGQ